MFLLAPTARQRPPRLAPPACHPYRRPPARCLCRLNPPAHTVLGEHAQQDSRGASPAAPGPPRCLGARRESPPPPVTYPVSNVFGTWRAGMPWFHSFHSWARALGQRSADCAAKDAIQLFSTVPLAYTSFSGVVPRPWSRAGSAVFGHALETSSTSLRHQQQLQVYTSARLQIPLQGHLATFQTARPAVCPGSFHKLPSSLLSPCRSLRTSRGTQLGTHKL